MYIKPFAVEEWMNEYEVGARFNIAETCVDSVSPDQLFALTGVDKQAFLADLCAKRLTYGDIVGSDALREGICKLYKTVQPHQVVPTHGAAGANHHVFCSLISAGDRVVSIMPTYQQLYSIPESIGAEVAIMHLKQENDYLPDLSELKALVTPDTKMICINNPNNPSGVVYNKETLIRLQKMLEKAEERIGHPIYVLSDEPYRELVYDGCELPFAPDYIKNCIVVYSFSKSLSLSGERIGYMAVSRQIAEYDTMINALVVANRCIGYINAPSLFQLVVADCLDVKTDVEFYDRNRKLLYESMKDMGFECVKPEGAFYMLVKAPTGDDAEFSAAAKKFNLLIVPATSFGCPGYVRMAYCVSNEMIHRALPALQKLADHYGLKK